MILRDEITKIVRSQRDAIKNRDQGIIRHDIIKIQPFQNFAILISGIRRCGKSTLLIQMMKKEENFYYLSFEDPRLIDFTIRDYELLEEVFHKEYGSQDLYFFDEIQNLAEWEYYIRHLLDSGKKVIITGSNASLLSRELGTKLTGRNLRLELFPFSYHEFLEYTNKEDSDDSFNDYLFTGGFPDYIRLGLLEVLHNLLLDIISRDIIYRNNIKNPVLITEIAVYLLGNIAREMTLSKLQKTFSAIGSTSTIASYLSHLEDAYILFTLSRFSYSHKSRQINPKKVYAIDNGLVCANSAGFSEDYGRLLENLVYIMLRKKYRELYYFREKHECDFIIKEKTRVTKVIQVCYEVTTRNKDREINGLLEAMQMFDLKEGYILTGNQEDELTVDGKKILLKPARLFSE